VKLGTDGAVAPITPLTSLPAVITENDPPAVKRQKKAVKNNILVDGVGRSARIAAARSMAVASRRFGLHYQQQGAGGADTEADAPGSGVRYRGRGKGRQGL
jgi:hypothetical protein